MNKKAIRNAIIAAPLATAFVLGGPSAAFANEVAPVAGTAAVAATDQVAGAAAVAATPATQSQQTAIFDGINQYRNTLGVAPVQFNTNLSGDAQDWSNEMANTNDVNYNYNIDQTATPGYENWTQLVGANTETGDAGAERLAGAWINDPRYYSIVGDPAWTHVGIGVTNPETPGYDPATGAMVYGTYGNITFWQYPDGTIVPGSYDTVAEAYAEPAPVDPAPVDPAPVDPEIPVDPAPVDPAPVDPAPVDPEVPVTPVDPAPAPVDPAPEVEAPAPVETETPAPAPAPAPVETETPAPAPAPAGDGAEVGTETGAEVVTVVADDTADEAVVAPAPVQNAVELDIAPVPADNTKAVAPEPVVTDVAAPLVTEAEVVADDTATEDVLADTGVNKNVGIFALLGALLAAFGVVSRKKLA